MHFIELHNGIHKMMEGYHRLGFWHRGNVTTTKQTLIKILHFTFHLLFTISLILGAMNSDNKQESLLLIDSAIITTVAGMRLFFIIWRQKEIFEFLHRIGVYCIKGKDDFTVVDNKLKTFMKWIGYFYFYTFVIATFASLLSPFILGGNKLFFNIAFPLDYKNNVFAFWIVYIFVTIQSYMTYISITFTITIWYLLFHCALRYKVLASDLRNMGAITTGETADEKRKISLAEKQNAFKQDLIAAIKSHKDINKLTQKLESFLSELFSVQLTTSAVGICIAVYNLAFTTPENIMDWQIYLYILLYNIGDIFMVMYYGNEIQVLSGDLSYCLFESNWIDQPQSCKIIVIIFSERLKQPQQLVILKLYPLTLETFMRILNGAYSMFNILKTLAV